MVELQKETLNKLWDDLIVFLIKTISTPEELREAHSRLLKFLAVAWATKVNLVELLKTYEKLSSSKTYLEGVRAGVIKNMHYEERRLLRLLSYPDNVREACYRLEVVNEMLAAAKQIEYSLKSVFETMKLDASLGYEGHD